MGLLKTHRKDECLLKSLTIKGIKRCLQNEKIYGVVYTFIEQLLLFCLKIIIVTTNIQ